MIRMLNRFGDRMLARLLPGTTADASICWNERCCGGKFCRTCCYQDSTGQTNCYAWDYC